MPLTDLKSKYSRKDLKFGPRDKDAKLISKYYEGHHKEPHGDFLYGFLCLIYDGINHINDLKSEMRLFFISATKQVVIEDTDVEEYIQKAKRKDLIKVNENRTIKLTKDGKKLVELSYFWNLHTTYWMRFLFSKTSVILASAGCLIILSVLKILIGLQLGSQGMLTEGFENLTDLIKVAIILIIGLKLKKDKLASIFIILIMMITGGMLVWSGIVNLLNPKSIVPTVQAFSISFLSIGLNVGLMYLKGMVGRTSGNLSLLSDSKDSALNVKLSISVIIGLTFAVFKIYYIDAIVGIIIAGFVFKEGIEFVSELIKKEEDFDITSLKVYADTIYENRLTGYILGSIRRENLTRENLIANFSKGLSRGRQYYEGFADFFYDELGTETAEKHLDRLLKGGYIEVLHNQLVLTRKGLRALYRAKMREFKKRSEDIEMAGHKILKSISCFIFITLIVLLIMYTPQINTWLANL